MNDPVIIKAAACVPVDVLLCMLLVFLVLLLQVFTCLSDIWPRASSCWANAGTFAVALIKNVLFVLSVFQATLTSSEDGSTGNLTLLIWTLWRATLATSAWISSAAETGDSESEDLFVFLQWSSLFFCLFGFFGAKTFLSLEKDSKETKASPLNLFIFHLLIHRSSTPSSQENQVVFPQTWHLLCSYTHIYFAHFCHSKAEFWVLI